MNPFAAFKRIPKPSYSSELYHVIPWKGYEITVGVNWLPSLTNAIDWYLENHSPEKGEAVQILEIGGRFWLYDYERHKHITKVPSYRFNIL